MKDFIVIHPSDNVGIALKVLEQGEKLKQQGHTVVLKETVAKVINLLWLISNNERISSNMAIRLVMQRM